MAYKSRRFRNDVTYPGSISVEGANLTVDLVLTNPQRITQRIATLADQRFIVDQLFSSTGVSVASGALVYETLEPGDVYTTRDVEQRVPTTEYPVVGGRRSEPMVAKAEDYGGKFQISDEARSRNQVTAFDQQVSQLAATILRKVNTRAVETLEAAITPEVTFTGQDWSAFTTGGTTPTSRQEMPARDFAMAQLSADRDELGVVFDLLLVNPQEHAALKIGYGEDLADILSSAGMTVFPSNRIEAGTAYTVATGQVGFLEFERQLGTEAWRDASTRSTWVQSSVVPLIGVTNPRAIRKITNLAG